MPLIDDADQLAGEAVASAYRTLRALRYVHDAGWARVVAAEPADGRYVLDLGPKAPAYRTLVRSPGSPVDQLRAEIWWWCVGMADARGGKGQAVLDLADEPLPEMVTLVEAAAMIPGIDRWGTPRAESMTVQGVTYNVQAGDLYAIYGLRRLRLLFRAQVELAAAERHLTAREKARQPTTRAEQTVAKLRLQWSAVRSQLPDVIRPGSLSVDVSPNPSPDPLPVAAKHAGTRARRALSIGDQARWFDYQSVDGEEYVVRIRGTKRRLPVSGVLAWVLGVADSRGAGHKVAYRENLG